MSRRRGERGGRDDPGIHGWSLDGWEGGWSPVEARATSYGCQLRARRQSTEERAENGDRRGSHARDARGLAEGLRADLRQTLHRFARESGDPRKGEVVGNAAALFPT